MSIYFNTNPMESRGLLAFQRTTNNISGILQRLETGYRINSAKDDPVGLVVREGMRADMKGMQAAINNTGSAMNMLTVADNAMAQIASLLNGSPDDTQDTGLIGLLNNEDASAAAKRQGVMQVLDSIDYISQSTVYAGRKVIGGDLDYNVLATGTNRNKISDIQVTRAEVKGATPLSIDFTVVDTAATSGVKIADTAVWEVEETDDPIQLVFTDSKGRSVSVDLTFDPLDVNGDDKTEYNAAKIKTLIQRELQNNSSVELALRDDTDGLIIESQQKGANQKVVAFSSGGAGTFVDINDATSTGTNITSTGKDWNISGLEGNIVSEGNYISVYSNQANFSADLEQAASGDTFTLQVAGGTSFQLGKDINDANRYNLGVGNVRSTTLGGAEGKLFELRSLDYSNSADLQKALKIVSGAISDLATQRGSLGSAMGTLNTNKENLEDQLSVVTEAEATISNTDAALESSRLARQELIAQSAVNSIQFSRAFAQFAVNSLF